MDLYTQYGRILENPKLWSFNLYGKIGVNIETLFESCNSSDFIKNCFFRSGYLDVIPWKELYSNGEQFENRARHTVSLFLLGILTVEQLGISVSDIPRYYYDTYANFLYLWLIMCLYHDMGYLYEDNSEKMAQQFPKIKNFIEYRKIKYNFLDVSKDSRLAEKYYDYIMKTYTQIDHGIVGGLLMYDGLMKYIEKRKELHRQVTLDFGDCRRFSDTNIECAKIMSESILHHNMWFADPDQHDEYKDAGLEELIPEEDKSNRYSLASNQLYFLLGLLDTIETVKLGFKNKPPILANDILKKTDILFNADNKEITISIAENLDTSKFFDSVRGLKNWLTVSPEVDNAKQTATIQIKS